MIYNINKKVSFARYGLLKHHINVTKFFKNNTGSFKITPKLFNYDKYPKRKKNLIMVIDNKKVILTDNDTIYINSNTNYDYILSTNVRDENNIVEWIIYHLLIGFDRILIIDHKSIIPVKDIISKYYFSNKVDVIESDKEGSVKLYFLNDIVIPYMKNNCNKYFIHLDGDEYINLNNNFDNVDELLQKYNYPNGLCLNWLMFGSNNVIINNDGFLLDKFIKCKNKIENHFKCFINVNCINNYKFINPHYISNIKYTNVFNKTYKSNNTVELFNNLYNDIDIEKYPAFINHYAIQSKEDLIKRKINRNRDDNNKNREWDVDEMFNKYNNIVYDNLYKLYFGKIIDKYNNFDLYGFIIIRYVKDEKTNTYWQKCYDCIRKFYNNKILIIDDHSDEQYLTNDKELVNCQIINSKYEKGRGELLPYIYFLENYFCERVIVLHDSMFINKFYDFSNIPQYKNFTRLFHFGPHSYKQDIEHFKEMCNYVKFGNEIYNYHKTNIGKMVGTFGICYIIDYEYLQYIENKYNITNLINYIDTRKKRQCLERFLSTLFNYDKTNNFNTNLSVFGCILQNLKNMKNNKSVYINKVFTGR